MRRKLPTTPIERPTFARPLSAALSGSRLPTAAALAVALAALGCASRGEDVHADPVAKTSPLVTPSASAAPSSSGPGLNAIDIDPEPHALTGEAAIVTPAPSASVKTTKHVPVVPTIKHRTAGVPPRVKPGHGDPFD